MLACAGYVQCFTLWNLLFHYVVCVWRRFLEEYAAVTELSPGRLFHPLVASACHTQALKFARSTVTSFGHQFQRLY